MSVGLLHPNRFYDFPKLLLIILSLPNVGYAPVPLINAPTLKSSKSGNFSSGVGNRGQSWAMDIGHTSATPTALVFYPQQNLTLASTEVEFVTAVTASGSVKFLPAV